jgi:hypothetical protein
MSRRAVNFDISPVGSVEKRAVRRRSGADTLNKKHVLSKVPGGNRRSGLFEGMLCHEHASKRDAVPKMKDGPSKPVCGNRLQTAVSCFRRKTAVVNVTVKAVEDHGMYE